MDRRKGFDLYHTEIVIIRKEVCPTSKFENIDQVTFMLPWINTGCFPPSSPTARYAEYFEK